MKIFPRALLPWLLAAALATAAVAEPQKDGKEAPPAPKATPEVQPKSKKAKAAPPAPAARSTIKAEAPETQPTAPAPSAAPGAFIISKQKGQKESKGKKKSGAAAEAEGRDGSAAATTSPAATPVGAPDHAAWQLEALPFAALGSGRPGKAASDFDKPDGLAFTPAGLLLATDAKNRRVQVWDVKARTHLGEFGSKVLGGEIVDIAVAPDGMVYVTDQTLNLAYIFVPPAPGAVDEKGKPLGPYDYQFKGTRFGEQGFDKLGGIAIDTGGRIYVVDAHLNDVRRFTPDGKPDPAWRFERARANGETYLHGCEGIAIDESAGNLYIASEKDAVIQVFDRETGAYRRKLVGAALDASGMPGGNRVFSGSVEGLTLAQNHLFAVDESVGHIQVFDLSRPNAFNTDLTGYGPRRAVRGGYVGFFGRSPLVDFDDKKNTALQQQVKDGSVIPGQANPPGHFCSPDAIASHTDNATKETYIAIADQCNYRLVVYRWSDLTRSFGPATVAAAPKKGKKN